MPTIKQLPTATRVAAEDQLPLNQGGVTRNASIGTLLAGTQPAIVTAQNRLLGRSSRGAGGPEPVVVGTGLTMADGVLSATGADHADLPVQDVLDPADEAVVNSVGRPRRLPLSRLRGLFSAGANIRISGDGVISTDVAELALQGPIGPRGDRGDVGPQGQPGPKGDAGTAGLPGPQGATGPQGPAGAQGLQGPKGDVGPAGPAGPIGSMGYTGPQGPAGTGGLAGPKGDAGAPGAAGPKGDAGPAGPAGAVGPVGPRGAPGADGAIGPAGPKGDAGALGPAGPQGSPGSPGFGSAPTAANTVASLAVADLVAVYQGGQPAWISYANLVPSQGVDQLPAAVSLSDTDACLVGQGGTLVRGTLLGLSDWIWSKQATTTRRRVEETASTTLTFARHHRAVVTCPNPITLSVANFAEVGDGFECEVVNTGTGTVTFGLGVTCASAATVAARQTVIVRGLAMGSGSTMVLANTPVPSGQPQTLTVNPISAQVKDQAFTVTGTYLNGTPAALDWSLDGAIWTGVAGATIGGGNYSFSLTLANTGNVILRVRDRVTQVFGNSGTFTVSATPPAPPGQVTQLTAGAPAATSVPLSWTAPATGGTPGTYTVEYRVGSGAWTTATSNSTASPYNVTGLTASTSYEFRVTAANSGGSGLASASTIATTTAMAPVLDTVATAAVAAYSTRRLRTAYAGAALRVRRSSDGTEQDIGFTSTGVLDMTALLAFVGSGNGFVSRLYDQSGKGYDAVQAAAAKQPKIVDAGTVQLFPGTGGRPSPLFTNTVEQLLAAPGVAVGGTDLTFIVALTTGAANANARAIGYKTTGKSGATADSLTLLVDTSGTRIRAGRAGTGQALPGVAIVTANTPHVASLASVGPGITLYDNGGNTVHGTVATSGSYGATGTVVLGGEGAGAAGETLSGFLSEAYVFTVLSAADRQAIEASMRLHYGV